MTRPIEERLVDVLSAEAGRVRDVPELGPRVVARGRVVRRRRGLTVAAGAVVLALGAWAGLSGEATRQAEPPAGRATTPGPSPSASADEPEEPVAPDPKDVQRWLESLPEGAPPAGPYEDAERRIVFGDTVVDSRADGPSIFFAGRTEGGVLAVVHTEGFTGAEDPGAWLALVRPDGSARRLVQGQFDGHAVAPDGRRVAVSVSRPTQGGTPSAYGWASKVLVLDVRTGRVTHSVQRAVPAFVAGWADGRVAWWETNPDGSGADEIWTWSPGGQPERLLDGVLRYALGTRLVTTSPGKDCGRLVELRRPTVMVGDGCAAFGEAISPDGRWFVRDDLSFQDLRTGRVTTTGALAGAAMAWDGPESVLVPVAVDRGAQLPPLTTLVRCRATDGHCERIPTLTHPKEQQLRFTR